MATITKKKDNRVNKKQEVNSLNYGWEGRDNLNTRQARYSNLNPAWNFYSPSNWIQGGWNTMFNIDRKDKKSTPHEEALYSRYLGGKRDLEQLPHTPVRFSRDYDYDDTPFTNKEYTGMPKQQKEAIRNHVIPNMNSDLVPGQWTLVKDNPVTSRHQKGAGNALSGFGKFGLRNNNNSGIYDFADTYDFPSYIPVPDRNKGYELEIRDTIWTKDAKPELYKAEKGFLPYNPSPLQKWEYNEVNKLIRKKR